MRIIILGAGRIGSKLAESLIEERSVDITLVDIDAERLNRLQEQFDIGVVEGVGSYPNVLRSAGAEDCDLLIAVTNSDETNMMACQIAQALFRVPTRIAYVRADAYLAYPQLFVKGCLAVDETICPENLVTQQINRIVAHPGAMQVLDFADDKAQMVTVMLRQDNPLVGLEVRSLSRHWLGIDARIAAIYRHGQPIIPRGDTCLNAGDEIFILAARRNTDIILQALHRDEKPYQSILIAGGGAIGGRLAKSLEQDYRVKIIERDATRCEVLASTLNESLVLLGDATDTDLLSEEGQEADLFCALTDSDEVNVIASIMARRTGVRETVTLLNKAQYTELMRRTETGIAISPSQVTVSALLARIRHGDVVKAHSLQRGSAEAIEAIAHGEKGSSLVVGRAINAISLPPTAAIGALIRRDDVIIGDRHHVIEDGDHIILFLGDKREIPAVERLFQVNPTFF